MKKKLFRITTISPSLSILLKGQLRFLSSYYEVIGVASGTNELETVSKRESIRTINIPMCREISFLRDMRSCVSLIFLFLKERPFIVHANTPKASLLSMIAAWITRRPHRIYTVTGLRFETTEGYFRKLLIGMEKLTCLCATKVIPEGEGVKKTLMKEGITKKELNVIFYGNINGVDIEYYSRTSVVDLLASKIRDSHKFTFCFVGRIVKDKGINELVTSFINLYDIYPEIRLILVGPFEKNLDPILPEIEYQILNHPSVLFADFQSDIRPYLVASDAFVFPSYREGFPNVVLQAGAMGLPLIVTDINGCNEIVENGVNGLIIPSHSVEKLYEAMAYFVEHRNVEVVEMSKVARSLIVERFEQQKVWGALLKEYQSL